MEIPNHDSKDNENNDFKQLYQYMPPNTIWMLICGNSGCGKTNMLYHMLMQPLLYYDQLHLYAKNLEQDKYQKIIEKLTDIGNQVGYDVISYSNDEITPIDYLLENEAQKIVIFDDYICEKKQKPLIDYFIRGRHNFTEFLQNPQRYKIKLLAFLYL